MTKITLTTDQQKAADTLLDFMSQDVEENQFIALASPPGCGKTVTVGSTIESLIALKTTLNVLLPEEEKIKNSVLTDKLMLTATTNKAAVELSKRSIIKAGTIYSALGLTLKPDYNTGKERIVDSSKNSVYNSVIVIDEATMVTPELMYYINIKCKRCKIVFVGDPDQLKGVGAKTMPAFNIPNIIYLDKIIRQKEGNFIRVLGAAFRDALHGKDMPTKLHDGFDVIHCNGAKFKREVNRAFGNPNYNFTDAKLLCWTNNKVHEYNSYIRKLRSGHDCPIAGELVVTRKPVFGKNRSFIHFVEEVLRISSVEPKTLKGVPIYALKMVGSGAVCNQPVDLADYNALIGKAASKAKKGEGWYEYFQIKEMFSDVRPVYAGTVHTAQGSTYTEIFIDLDDISKCPVVEDLLRLLHVAVTRATTRVWLYGDL